MFFAALGALPASAAPAPAEQSPRLVTIVNPQGNFLSDGLGKILHAGPSFGGQLVWNWEFAQALAKSKSAGYPDVDIVTQQVTKGTWPKEMARTVTEVHGRRPLQGRVRIVRIPLSEDGTYLDKEDSYPRLGSFAELLRRFYVSEARTPNLLYAAYADGAAVAEAIRKATGVPYLFHPHSLGRAKRKSMIERAIKRGDSPEQIAAALRPYRFASRIHHETAAIRNAIGLVANSNTEVDDQHLANYGRTAQKASEEARYFPIPPGLKDAFLRDPGAAADAPAVAAFEKDVRSGKVAISGKRSKLPVLFTYARPVPIKNISEFVRAVAMDRELLRTHNIVVVAKPPQKGDAQEIHDEWAKLHDLIAHPKDAEGRPINGTLEGKIAIIGPRPQDDIAAILRHLATRPGSLHVNPAVYEAFGLTVIEAMAAGLPVAATNNGGPNEHPIVATFPPNDHREMARVIRQQASRKTWAKKSAEGKRYAQDFTWPTAAARHARIASVAQALAAPAPAFTAKPAIDGAKLEQGFQRRERRADRAFLRSFSRPAPPAR